MAVTVEHDRAADALYVRLSDRPYSHGRDLDAERRIDYASDGTPVGVEVTCVSLGVDLSGLPQVDEIAAALKEREIRTEP